MSTETESVQPQQQQQQASLPVPRARGRGRGRGRGPISAAEADGEPPAADAEVKRQDGDPQQPQPNKRRQPRKQQPDHNSLKTQSGKGRRRAANREQQQQQAENPVVLPAPNAVAAAPASAEPSDPGKPHGRPKRQPQQGGGGGGGGGGKKTGPAVSRNAAGKDRDLADAGSGAFNSASGGLGYSRKRQGRMQLNARGMYDQAALDPIARRALAENGPQEDLIGRQREIRRPQPDAEQVQEGRRRQNRRNRIGDLRRKLVMRQPVSGLVLGHSQQAADLIRALCSNEYECLICSENVDARQPIWGCGRCSVMLHLGCARDWALTSVGKDAEQAAASAEEGGPIALVGVGPEDVARRLRLQLARGVARQQQPQVQQPPSSSSSPPPPQGQLQALFTRAWRCPNCLLEQLRDPDYSCFCGRETHPRYNPYLTPHGCGDSCGRMRPGGCPHPCALACHPGACPPCTAEGPLRPCACGRTQFRYRCDEGEVEKTCAQSCDRLLGCGMHRCEARCHTGPCEPCPRTQNLGCWCGRSPADTERLCGSWDQPESPDQSPKFRCGQTCDRELACGEHRCQETCHSGACPECPLLPGKEGLQSCACGRSELSIVASEQELAPGLALARRSCTDPLPTCTKICDRELACGHHRCLRRCHGPEQSCSATQGLDDSSPAEEESKQEESSAGELSVCRALVRCRCRCGHRQLEIPCRTFSDRVRSLLGDGDSDGDEQPRVPLTAEQRRATQQEPDPQRSHPAALCTRRCGLHMNCQRHRCPERCCGQSKAQHRCLETCDRPLACGRHRCDRFCHSGACSPCEVQHPNGLRCPCGFMFTPGPVRCGEPTQVCPKACSQRRGAPDVHLTDENVDPDYDEGSEVEFLQRLRNWELARAAWTKQQTTVARQAGKRASDTPVDPRTPPDPADPGAQPEAPACRHPCSRGCHMEPDCGRCVVRVARLCTGGAGGHRRTKVLVSCWDRFQAEVGCGQVCGQLLPCGSHRCRRSCHIGDCGYPAAPASSTVGKRVVGSGGSLFGVSTAQLAMLSRAQAPAGTAEGGDASDKRPLQASEQEASEQRCWEPCPLQRSDCAHPCGARCHPQSPCPGDLCAAQVRMTCACGRRSLEMSCAQGRGLDPRLVPELSADEAAGHLVTSRTGVVVPCDQRCLVEQRNERFSRALDSLYSRAQPEDSAFAPRFGSAAAAAAVAVTSTGPGSSAAPEDFVPYPVELLEEIARLRLGSLLERVEPVFREFARPQPAGDEKTNHFFAPMPAPQRWLLHQLATQYGLSATSYDPEPKRSVAIARTPNCASPRISLTEAFRRHQNNPRQLRTAPAACSLQLFHLRLQPSRVLSAVERALHQLREDQPSLGLGDPGFRLNFLGSGRAVIVCECPEAVQEARRSLKPFAQQQLLSFTDRLDDVELSEDEEPETSEARELREAQEVQERLRQRELEAAVRRPGWLDDDWGSGGSHGWRRAAPASKEQQQQADDSASDEQGVAPWRPSWQQQGLLQRPDPSAVQTGDTGGADRWSCPQCSYQNSAWDTECSQCGNANSAVNRSEPSRTPQGHGLPALQEVTHENPWHLLAEEE